MLDIESRWYSPLLTVPGLYRLVLNRCGPIPSFCQKLEEIISMGKRALHAGPSSYMTPRDYIFRFLFGDECYIDSEYELAVGDRKGMLYDIFIPWNVDNNEFISHFQCLNLSKIPMVFATTKSSGFSELLEEQIAISVGCVSFEEFCSTRLIHTPQAHREQDFAYISEDVEILYRSASPIFLEDGESEEFWEFYAAEEL